MIDSPDKLFMGVTATTGQNRYTYAVFSESRNLITINHNTQRNFLDFLRLLNKCIIAVNLPSQLHHFITTFGKPQQNMLPINLAQAVSRKTKLPGWYQKYRRFIQLLEQSGVKPFESNEASRQWISSSSELCYQQLLTTSLYLSRSIEGRIQRQLFIYNLGLKVPDPMTFFEEITRHRILNGKLNYDSILSQPELDAIILAYTAWLYANEPDRILIVHTTDMEKIILPISISTSSQH